MIIEWVLTEILWKYYVALVENLGDNWMKVAVHNKLGFFAWDDIGLDNNV